MYAMTKHIKKAMAAVLCVCLLLSYNPAFGMVGTAEAVEQVVPLESPVPSQSELNNSTNAVGGLDYGTDGVMSNGTASTTVNVTTYNGGLQTNCTPSFSADRAQISSAAKLELIVQALSTRATGNGSYTYEWTLARDGEPATQDVLNRLASYTSKKYDETNKNSSSVINLKSLFDADSGYFADGHTFTFTCVTKCAGDEITNVIELVTVNSEEYEYPTPDPDDPNYPDPKPVPPNPLDPNFPDVDPPDPSEGDPSEYPKRLDATSGNGVAGVIYTAQGGFREGAQLQSETMTPSDEAVNGKKFDAAARDTSILPADPTGADYELGPILVNSITGVDGNKPAYIGQLTMFVPVDNFANSTDGMQRYDYKQGDKIWVLYQNPETGEVKAVEATIVNDPADGNKLKAAFVVDKVNGPYMPGNFALAYAPSEVRPDPSSPDPENPDPVQPLKYHYTINATWNANYGTVESTAEMPTGTWTTTKEGDSTGASYAFVPKASETTSTQVITYSLDYIKFGLPGSETTIVTGKDTNGPFIKVDGETITYTFIDGILKLYGCAPDTAYSLVANFKRTVTPVSSLPDPVNPIDPNNPRTYDVNVSIVPEKAGDTIGNAAVNISYTNTDTTAAAAAVTAGQSSATVAALTGTTVHFNFLEGEGKEGDTSYTYYLKEIRSNTTEITPVSNSTSVVNTVNGSPIYRQFVVGKRTTTYEPGAENPTAYFHVDADGHGSVSPASLEFVQNEAGNPATFTGSATSPNGNGYYAEYVNMYKREGNVLLATVQLANTDYDRVFEWADYTRYGFDIDVYVHFEQRPEIPMYKVYLNDSVEHGTITPSGWEVNNEVGYREGTELVFSVKADEGYQLNGDTITVQYRSSEGVVTEDVPVLGGFARVTVKGDIINLNGSFQVIPAGDKPPTGITENYNLNVYVANQGWASSYLKNIGTTATGVNVVKPDGTTITATDVSLTGYKSTDGTVNGAEQQSVVVTATKADGYPTYSLSMKATEGHEVEKILVVKYNTNGTPKERVLYKVPWPAFDVTNIDANTDVVVYFKELKDDEPPAYNPGDIKWVDVYTTYIPAAGISSETTYKPNESSPLMNHTQIIKGQGYMNRIVPSSGYSWQGLAYGGQTYTDVYGSASPQTVNLTCVEDDTTYITAMFGLASTMPSPDDPTTKYNTLTAPSGIQHGSVIATVGGAMGTSQRALGTWSGIREGATPVTLTMKSDSGYYLSNLSIEADNHGSYKVIVNKTTHELSFVTGSNMPEGWELLASAGNLATDADKTAAENLEPVEWTITGSGLCGNLLITPTFALLSSGGSGDGDGDDDGNGNGQGGVTEPDPDKFWVVKATVTEGNGSVVSPQAPDGFPLRVSKASERTIKLFFTPGKNQNGDSYKITDIKIKKDTDNVFTNITNWLMGLFGASDGQAKANEAMQNGYLELKVDANYDIEVAFGFETDPTKPGYVPPANQVDSNVVVNAYSDAFRGTVTPTSALVAKADGAQQFVVSPFLAKNGLYYSVVGVKVNGEEIPATTKNDPRLTWDTSYANVFTVNVGALNIPENELSAVNVEIIYSEDGNVAGNFGQGGSSQTPALNLMKKMSVDVNDNAAGSVYPAGGPFYVLRMNDDGTYNQQKVSVTPAKGYSLASIEVTVGGNPSTERGEAYYEAAMKDGCFYVDTEDQRDEFIVVNFKLDSYEQTTYTLRANVASGQDTVGIVVPYGTDVRLPAADYAQEGDATSFTFTAAPKKNGYIVSKVEDTFALPEGMSAPAGWATTADGRVIIPQGEQGSVTWDRGADTDPAAIKDLHNIFVASEVSVAGIGAVDRYITVYFTYILTTNGSEGGPLKPGVTDPNDPKYDFSDPDNEKGDKDPDDNKGETNLKDSVDLRVNIWGYGYDQVDVDPDKCLLGVYPGKLNGQELEYPYMIHVKDAAYNGDDNGYLRIYCVEVNGKILKGNKTTLKGSDLLQDYSMVFSNANGNMKRPVNTLNVYVRYFTSQQINSDETFTIGTGKIEVVPSDNGTVVEKNAKGTYSASSRYAAAADLSDRELSFGPNSPDQSGTGGGWNEDDESSSSSSSSSTSGSGTEGSGSETTGQTPMGGGSASADIGGGTNNGNLPEDFYFVPKPGYVVNQVYLWDCEVVEYAWVTPKDVPDVDYTTDPAYKDYLDKPIVLKYSLVRTSSDPEKDGLVLVKYKALSTMTDAEREQWLTDPEEIYGWDKILGDQKDAEDALNADFENTVVVAVKGNVNDLSNRDVLQIADSDALKAEWVLREDVAENQIRYKTIKFDQYDEATGDFKIVVGPLIEADEDNNPTVVYTINKDWIATNSEESSDPNSLKLTVVSPSQEAAEQSMVSNAYAAEGEDASTDDGKEVCYQNYVITGNLKNIPSSLKQGNEIRIEIPLEKKDLKDVKLPEFAQHGSDEPGTDPGDDDDNSSSSSDSSSGSSSTDPGAQKTATIVVNTTGNGTVTPALANGESWVTNAARVANTYTVTFDKDETAKVVAFTVAPSSNQYRLKSLTRDGQSCFTNEDYLFLDNGNSGRLAFTVTPNSGTVTVDAEFDTVENATIAVTPVVVGGHGELNLESGKANYIPIGSDLRILLDPDPGYVIDTYRLSIGKDAGKVMRLSSTVKSVSVAQLAGYSGIFENATIEFSFKEAGSDSGSNPSGLGPGQGSDTDNPLVVTGQSTQGGGTNAGLMATGDSLVIGVVLVVIAAAAVATVLMARRRKATASRAVRYSVTPRRR